MLLKQGADIHATNKNGWTPLHWGALNNATNTAEVLLKNGADVNAKNKNGDTPLHWAEKESMKRLLRLYGEKE